MNQSRTRRIARFFAALATFSATIGLAVSAPLAAAAPCPDVEVVFARGTDEDAGVGGTGQAFIDALRAQTKGKSVDVYAVNYPADRNFANSIAAGADDARGHVQARASECPDTKMVLGGYSQGAS